MVLKNEKPVVVDFWAVWCGPCKMVAPEMEKIAAKYEGAVDVVKVDVDANPRLSQAFNIMSIPTIAFFRPGEQPMGVVGFRPLEQLEQQFGLAAAHRGANRGGGGRGSERGHDGRELDCRPPTQRSERSARRAQRAIARPGPAGVSVCPTRSPGQPPACRQALAARPRPDRRVAVERQPARRRPSRDRAARARYPGSERGRRDR